MCPACGLRRKIVIPNATNGLLLVKPPWKHILYFQSCHGEHLTTNYMSDAAVPLSFIIELLTTKEDIIIVDGTSSGNIPRAFKCGFLTFCMVWERARIGKDQFTAVNRRWSSQYNSRKNCITASFNHKKLVNMIRKFSSRVGAVRPIHVVDKNGNVTFSSNDSYESPVNIVLSWEKVDFDDDHLKIKKYLDSIF